MLNLTFGINMKVQKLTKTHHPLDSGKDSCAIEQDFIEPDQAENNKSSSKVVKKYGDGVEVS